MKSLLPFENLYSHFSSGFLGLGNESGVSVSSPWTSKNEKSTNNNRISSSFQTELSFSILSHSIPIFTKLFSGFDFSF